MARSRNPNLKKANQQGEYTHQQVLELKRCAEDPVYFIKTYVKIQHPIRGSIPFELYDYQEDMVRTFHNNRYTVVLSARQTGKSQTAGAYLLWFAIFHFDKTILVASNKNSNAMEMVARIKYAYENLPLWLKPGIQEDQWNKHVLGFDNNSRIISEATSENSGRGLAISLLYLDEFAFVPPDVQSEFWTSISPTLATGGSCIMTSTPNGDINIFAEIWRGAQVEANGFIPIRVFWNQPPGRDEKFKEQQIGQVGERMWMQEYECEFLSSDALLIRSLVLQNLTKELKNVRPKFVLKETIFWSDVSPGRTYLVGVDPATGIGTDFTVISVFEFPTMLQVAEFRSNSMSTNDVYDILKNLLNYLVKKETQVYVSIENNGVGDGIISLFEADDSQPDVEFVSEAGRNKRGMTTTSKSKMKACVNLREMIEKNTMFIRSPILLNELKQFVRKRGAYAAQPGSTDDCISSVLVIIRLIEEIASYDQSAFDKLYSGGAADGEWSDKDITNYSDDDEPLPVVF